MDTPAWLRELPEMRSAAPFTPYTTGTLSLEERDRRWAALRRKMAMRDIDCLLFVGTDINWGMGMANVRYITQIGSALGAQVVFPLVGEPIVYNGVGHLNIPGNIHSANPVPWVQDVRPFADIATICKEIADRGLNSKRVGLVGFRRRSATANIGWQMYEAIKEALPGITISDETLLLDELRLIKSAEEIRLLERASEIAVKRVKHLGEVLRPGMTEREAWADMEHTQLVEGGEPCTFNLFMSGSAVKPVEAGLQHLLHGSEWPASPSDRVLESGDLLIAEFHSQVEGYLAATEFSWFIGKAPDPLRRVHDVAIMCEDAAHEAIKPGATFLEVWSAMNAVAERERVDFIELGFHGHGLASPEYPTIVYRPSPNPRSAAVKLGSQMLEPGMVLGINIDVHDSTWRKDVGIMFGGMVVVEEHGCRPLVAAPRDLFEV